MSFEELKYLFKRDPLAIILPVAMVLWLVYCVFKLTYARSVLEAVRWGSFSIINAIMRRPKK